MEEQKFCYSPKPFNGFKNGPFISEIFDSGNAGTVWDRLKLEIYRYDNASALIKTELRVYISDDKGLLLDNRGLMPEDKVIVSKYHDILLYPRSINGRYLRFEVKLLNGSAGFNAYELTFPKISFTRYLPAIYQGNDGLDRFLAIYQNRYLDAEREIMYFYRSLDARESEMLNWIAGLTSAEMFLCLPEKNFRKLLSVIALLYKIKGTKDCVKLLVYALTGEVPLIIDCAEEMSESRRAVFGAQNGHFYIMLNSRPGIDPGLFNYLIKQFIPVNAHYTTVFLSENRVIGGFCFLGMNSIISTPKRPIAGESRLGEDLRL
jgi:phage tail-like protein